jgi:hypothetical protein
MTHENQNHNALDIELIIDYLYDSLSPSERTLFEDRLNSDNNFRMLFEQNQSMDELVSPGADAEISDSRMDAVNYSLGRKLRKNAQESGSLFKGLSMIWQSKVSFKAQFASMAVTFLLGAFLFQSTAPISAKNQDTINHSEQPQAVSLIKNDDYQITDLTLTPVGSDGERVKVTYSLTSKTQFEERLDSKKLQQLLAATLKSDVNDATRLEMVEALTSYADSNVVTEVFGYSLLNDPNPGVRLAALQSLAKLAQHQEVREVLTQALRNDINSGVRIGAFNALNAYLDDPQVISTLANYAIKDSNIYIRHSTQLILQKRLDQQAPQT